MTSNLHVDNPHRSSMTYVAASDLLHRTASDVEASMVTDIGFTTREPTADPSAANLVLSGRA
jgi:hypothetical protein